MLRRFFFLEREFDDIAFADALQFFHLVVVSRDETTLCTLQIADRALKLGLGDLKICFRGSDVTLGAADFRGDLPELRRGIGLYGTDLLAELLVALLLTLLDGLRKAACTGQLVLGEAELLRGHFQLTLQLGNSAVRFFDFCSEGLRSFIGLVLDLLSALTIRIAGVEHVAEQEGEYDHKKPG